MSAAARRSGVWVWVVAASTALFVASGCGGGTATSSDTLVSNVRSTVEDPGDGAGPGDRSGGDEEEDLDLGGVNSDPSDGVCNEDRFVQDPDCGINTDPSDGSCDESRFMQDPDC